MILSQQDLRELTGYVNTSAQRRWLNDRGWKHEVDRFGKPKVLRAEMERKMLGSTRPRSRELNLPAIQSKKAA